MLKQIRKNILSHKLSTFFSAIIIIALASFIYMHLFSANKTSKADSSVRTIANKSSQQGSSIEQGGATDTSGSSTPSTNAATSDHATTSSSGVITLQQPGNGDNLKSGDTISGQAAVGTVQYRLVDNQMGVIAQGSLHVVNNKFSGVLSFKNTAKTGKLDVFSYDSSYNEINEASVNVNFGP